MTPQDTALSAHFNLSEFTISQSAARLGLDNTPSLSVLAQLAKTALGMEMVRTLLQAPIHINSGYRSPIVNKAVGGAANSQHVLGEAVDFICPGFGTPARIVAAIRAGVHQIPYDQVIMEFCGWVHISFSDSPRRQALVIDMDGTRPWV